MAKKDKPIPPKSIEDENVIKRKGKLGEKYQEVKNGMKDSLDTQRPKKET